MVSRLPKAYLIVAACFLSILFLGLTFRSSKASSIWHSSSLPLHTSPPLLGAEENPAALWLPPKGTKFELEVPGYLKHQPSANRIRTPLFIAFSRNYELLEQALLSYISVGWPREDIIVVDNTGTFDANNRRELSKDNPFFLDHDLLRSTYGVSIMQTPTLFNFPQLMNFYLRMAVAQDWAFYFWSHQDVAVLSNETAQPFKSFYQGVLDVLNDLDIHSLQSEPSSSTMNTEKWAVKWFSYDWLSLNNVEAWRTIGPWDTFIPYYSADCDAYSRILLNGFTREEVRVGHVFDVADAVTDRIAKFFSPDPTEAPNSSRFIRLRDELEALMQSKWHKGDLDRNTWQTKQKGGKGEAWTYSPGGFQTMWWETANHGRSLFETKWGTTECQLERTNIKLGDEFRGG